MFDDNDPGRGAMLAAVRRARPMTQEVLAAAAGVSVQTVRRAEAGRPLSAETVQGLCVALGIDASSIRAPSGTPAPSTAHAAARSTSALEAAPAGTDPSSYPMPVEAPRTPRRSRVRGSTWVVIVFSVFALASQWFAWTGAIIDGQDWFGILDAMSLTTLAVAASILSVRRASAKQGTWARRRAWALAAISICAVLAPTFELGAGIYATAQDVGRGLHDYVRVSQVVKIRAIMEPGWDAAEARWKVWRMWQQVWSVRSPRLETPGTYETFESKRPACKQMYLHAAVYPRDQCEYENVGVYDSRPVRFWKELTGGSAVVHRPDDVTMDDAIGDEAFAAARRIFDAHAWSKEIVTDTWWHRFVGTESGFDWVSIETEARAYSASGGDGTARSE